MEYPKPIMSITELEQLGFSKTQLREVARRKGQKCSFRVSNKPKSKIMFYTSKLDAELQDNERKG